MSIDQRPEASVGLEVKINELTPDYRVTMLAHNCLATLLAGDSDVWLSGKTQQTIPRRSGGNTTPSSEEVTSAINDVLQEHDIVLSAALKYKDVKSEKTGGALRRAYVELEAPRGLDLKHTRAVTQFLRTRIDYLRAEIDDRKFAMKAKEAASNQGAGRVTITTDSRYLLEPTLEYRALRTNELLYPYGDAVKLSGTNEPGTILPKSSSDKPARYSHNISVERTPPRAIIFD